MPLVGTGTGLYGKLAYVKAISYARASMDRTGEELSVDRQVEDQRTLARVRGWSIVREIIDNDVSASGKRRRPGFEQALEAVRRGDAQMIVSTDMSRLTRGKARDEVRLLELGVETGLLLSFVRAPDLDLSTAAGRLTASILIAAARHEIEQKSERQRRASRQAAEQGRRVGGRRPFGYGKVVGTDPGTGKPVRDYNALIDDEAKALRDAYDAVLHGVSLGRIARDWNDRGLHTPQETRDGQPSLWNAQTVRPVLLNPRYAGLRHHVDEKLRRSMLPTKARLAGIVGPAQWPPVVDETVWRAVVSILTAPDRARQGSLDRRLLTGVALCGVCGATVHGGANPQHQPTYRCSAAYGHVGRRSEPVDEYVEEGTVRWLGRADAALPPEDDTSGVVELRTEMGALRARLNEQAALHAAGDIDTAQLRAGSALLRRRLEETEAQVAAAGRASIVAPLLGAGDVRAQWAALDLDRRRAIIDQIWVVRLLPPGRGTRTFRPETVVMTRRQHG
jgi:site-specific DNA recombinase